MLPFTKRARRDEEPEEATLAGVRPKGADAAASGRSLPSLLSAADESDDDEDKPTSLLSRSGLSAPSLPALPAPTPAAGRPASIHPRSHTASGSIRPPTASGVRPPPSYPPPPASVRPAPSSRPVSMNRPTKPEFPVNQDGRAKLRTKSSLPPGLGLQAPPASLSLENVRRAALDSAYPSRARALESSADLASGVASRSGARRSPERTPSETPRSVPPVASYPPPGSVQVREIALDGSGSYRSRRQTSSASVPAMSKSVPAHFARPQAPYSDPPGTAITAGNRYGRPTRAWIGLAAAVAVFVGVVGVAIVHAGEPAVDATAAFVDPSRTETLPPPPATNALANAPAEEQAPPAAQPAAPANGLPPGVIGASPTVAPAAPAVSPAPTSAPIVAVVPVVVTPSTAAPAAAPVATVAAVAPVTVTPMAKAAPLRQASAPAWKPPPSLPRPAAKAPIDDEPVAKKSPPVKKSGKGGDSDAEMRKAMEDLQKAQLESSSSF